MPDVSPRWMPPLTQDAIVLGRTETGIPTLWTVGEFSDNHPMTAIIHVHAHKICIRSKASGGLQHEIQIAWGWRHGWGMRVQPLDGQVGPVG